MYKIGPGLVNQLGPFKTNKRDYPQSGYQKHAGNAGYGGYQQIMRPAILHPSMTLAPTESKDLVALYPKGGIKVHMTKPTSYKPAIGRRYPDSRGLGAGTENSGPEKPGAPSGDGNDFEALEKAYENGEIFSGPTEFHHDEGQHNPFDDLSDVYGPPRNSHPFADHFNAIRDLDMNDNESIDYPSPVDFNPLHTQLEHLGNVTVDHGVVEPIFPEIPNSLENAQAIDSLIMLNEAPSIEELNLSKRVKRREAAIDRLITLLGAPDLKTLYAREEVRDEALKLFPPEIERLKQIIRGHQAMGHDQTAYISKLQDRISRLNSLLEIIPSISNSLNLTEQATQTSHISVGNPVATPIVDRRYDEASLAELQMITRARRIPLPPSPVENIPRRSKPSRLNVAGMTKRPSDIMAQYGTVGNEFAGVIRRQKAGGSGFPRMGDRNKNFPSSSGAIRRQKSSRSTRTYFK
jgi:hypothetical protein